MLKRFLLKIFWSGFALEIEFKIIFRILNFGCSSF
jgi:hypothetical protein